jgi:DNA-binding MarR family transcriptional regulator
MAKRSRDELLERIGDLARADQVSTDRLDNAASEVMGINRTDHTALDVIERAGPITAGELAKETGLSPAAMTAAIDRLEQAGAARRIADPGDRRRVLVEITPAASKRAWEIYGPLKEAFVADMQRYSVKDLELLVEFYERGLKVKEKELERIENIRPWRRRAA